MRAETKQEFPELSLEEILAHCRVDSKFMAKLLFKDAFFAPMTPLHDKLFDFIDNCDAKKKLIVATRGLGKTTIAQFVATKRILFSDRHFVGYLTNSGENAKFYTNSIKADLTSNVELRKIFGDVRESKVEGSDERWAQTSWIANIAEDQTLVVPRGAGQQVRGLLWKHVRPDFWIIDDLEDDEEVLNEEQRKKLRRWFYGAFMLTVSQWEKFTDYEMIYVDTIKHEDALVTYLMDDPDWEVLKLPVCDKNYETLAPDFVSQETLNREIENARRNRTLNVFTRERMCETSSVELGSFKQEHFKYYDENDPKFVKEIAPRLINILILDPSKTENPANAESAYVVWGLDFEYNAFYARYAQGFHLSPHDMHKKFFELVRRYNVKVAGVEATGLEAHITYPLRNEMLRNRLYIQLIELKARTGKGELTGEEGGKTGRIRSLLPFFESGLVWINPQAASPLEHQLLSFPNAKLKDVSDSASYLSQMLDRGARFMSPPPMEEEESRESIEQEYAMLDNEPPLQRQFFL